ncbi:hypothetical protein E8E11_001202 [Didymella keratinophila]|nr:hypothetical protein E8E11_001202 [Didymella keratinophila]
MTLHDLSCIDSFRRNLPSLEKSLAHSDNKGVRRVREQLMDLYPKVVNGQKAKYQAEVAVEWDLRGFMSSQFGSRLPAVASIVVLSGTVASAQASTCSNYLRDTWPTTGKYFVQLLEDVALKRKMPVNRDFKDSEDPNISDPSQKQLGGPEDETHDGPLTVKICVGPDSYSYCIMPRLRTRRNCASGIRLFIEADELSKVAEITEQLAWSACALSTSPFGDELAYTVFNLRKQRGAKNDAPLLEGSIEHIPLPDSESSCWIPLFNGACIARDFPVAVRCAKVEDDQRGPHAGEPRPEVEFEDEGYEEEPAMRGLEIPLHLLAEIGGVRHVVEYGGGLVMKGFSHMFIPIRGKKNLVQWHAVSSTDPDVRLTYEDALRQCSTRATLKEVSLKDLETTRAILGWCSVATSRLGSSHADYENIDYSGSEEATSRFRLAGGQLGFQQFGVAALDFRLGAKDGKCHFRRAGTYDRVVSAAEKTPVVLYDTCALRSWLVNASDVILHMIQHRHQSRPYKTHQGQIELCTQIKTGSSARQVLLANQDICLGDEDEQTFKNEVFTLWSLLELLIDQNVSRERNAQGVRVKTDLREHLVGFEYRAVVDDRSPFRLMTTDLLKSHGGWPSLIRDIDALVLLANGFGELILPSDQDRGAMCSAWHRVPEGRDYMATSTTSLKDMYDVAGCRVDRKYLTSSKLQWHQGESLLFDACSDKQNCKCDRLQQIMSSTAMGKTVQPQHMAEHGAVIFGQPKSLPRGLRKKFRAESHEASSLYLQPNEPLTKTQSPSVTIVIPPKDIDNATTPDSAYQSASDSSFGSTPNSLSSWVPPSAQEGLLPTIREAPPSKYKCILSAEDEVKEIVKGKKRMWTPPKTPVMEFEPQRSLRRVEAFVMQPKRSRRL